MGWYEICMEQRQNHRPLDYGRSSHYCISGHPVLETGYRHGASPNSYAKKYGIRRVLLLLFRWCLLCVCVLRKSDCPCSDWVLTYSNLIRAMVHDWSEF